MRFKNWFVCFFSSSAFSALCTDCLSLLIKRWNLFFSLFCRRTKKGFQSLNTWSYFTERQADEVHDGRFSNTVFKPGSLEATDAELFNGGEVVTPTKICTTGRCVRPWSKASGDRWVKLKRWSWNVCFLIIIAWWIAASGTEHHGAKQKSPHRRALQLLGWWFVAFPF